jgi:hypothetical protein
MAKNRQMSSGSSKMGVQASRVVQVVEGLSSKKRPCVQTSVLPKEKKEERDQSKLF